MSSYKVAVGDPGGPGSNICLGVPQGQELLDSLQIVLGQDGKYFRGTWRVTGAEAGSDDCAQACRRVCALLANLTRVTCAPDSGTRLNTTVCSRLVTMDLLALLSELMRHCSLYVLVIVHFSISRVSTLSQLSVLLANSWRISPGRRCSRALLTPRSDVLQLEVLVMQFREFLLVSFEAGLPDTQRKDRIHVPPMKFACLDRFSWRG